MPPVEVNDALFCEHGLEVCKNCEFDGREGECPDVFRLLPILILTCVDNDAVMGYVQISRRNAAKYFRTLLIPL